MADDIISDNIRQFILQEIESVAQLEGLLLLRGDRRQDWTAEAVARRLYIGKNEAARLLARLAGTGLLAASGKRPLLYGYRPESAALEDLAARLADTYARYLLPVTHLIHSKPKSRIQEFADAFLIRKNKE